jgi:prephenate dehydrogenase
MLPETLGVIGLGAVGGSVAWRATRQGVRCVIGYCFSRKDGVAAAKSGAVSELATDIRRVAAGSELVVLATCPRKTIELLERIGGLIGKGTFLTDTSPVKVPVVSRATQLGLSECFAGSHPFAGSHNEGFELAHPDRLESEIVYVTPLGKGDEAAREVADFWDRAIGAQPVTLEAEVHDRVIAWTQHLPRAAASALAAALKHSGPKGSTYGAEALAATDVAGGAVDLWADVLTMNAEHMLNALGGIEDELRSLKDALGRRDRSFVREWLEEARNWRRGVGP